jgi:cell division protein ZapA
LSERRTGPGASGEERDPKDTTRPVHVRIAGEEHVIRSRADPEHTRRCARLLDDRIAQIRQRAGVIEPPRAAILAALSLADELLRAQEDMERVRSAVSRTGEVLARRLDDASGVSAPEGSGDPRGEP